MTKVPDAYMEYGDDCIVERVDIDPATICHIQKPRWHECVEFCDKYDIWIHTAAPHTPVNNTDNYARLVVESFEDWQDPQIFLVNRQWSQILPDEVGAISNQEIRLPADICVFEFQFATCHVCYLIDEEEDGSVYHVAFIRHETGEWTGIGFTEDIDSEAKDSFALLWHEVKAMLVALDADVAEVEAIRAPTFINRKRAKKNKPPLNDYNVVRLANRHRITNPHDGESSGRRHRLHFRRGHWRHYHDHKTWIKWQLVGDPSLGFVDKHYEA